MNAPQQNWRPRKAKLARPVSQYGTGYAPLRFQVPTFLRSRLFFRNEVLLNRFLHQAWWKKTLRKNEIVEAHRVELWPKRRFRRLPQLQQARVAIEVAIRLPRAADGVAFHLLIRKRNR